MTLCDIWMQDDVRRAESGNFLENANIGRYIKAIAEISVDKFIYVSLEARIGKYRKKCTQVNQHLFISKTIVVMRV